LDNPEGDLVERQGCSSVEVGGRGVDSKAGEVRNEFRTISLLSVEGEIFPSIVSKHLTDFLLGNYIGTWSRK